MSFVMLRFLSVPNLISVASITGYIRTLDIPWYLRSLLVKLLRRDKTEKADGSANAKARGV